MHFSRCSLAVTSWVDRIRAFSVMRILGKRAWSRLEMHRGKRKKKKKGSRSLKMHACEMRPEVNAGSDGILICIISTRTCLLGVRVLSCFSHVQLFAALWTVASQAPLSKGSSSQEYWSGFPCPPPGHLPDPGIKSMSLKSPA